jgi:hypothetical protein
MKAKDLIDAGIEPISERDLETQYMEMLDDVYGMIKIGAYEYETSIALIRTDPTAFNVGYADWRASELDERLVEIDGEYFDRNEVEEFQYNKDNKENVK